MFDMTPYEQYSFIVCMIVYVVLTILFTTLIVCILRLSLKLIRNGVEDEKIEREYEKACHRENGSRIGETIERVFTTLACLALFCIFGFSIYTQFVADNKTEIPTYRVVLSGSMSQKYEKNKYLFDNNLNDQFQRFDLVLTRQLPKEEDLKLYDIVVYEVDGNLVIHRIVGIEEPNEKHPDERHFRLQGDNVHVADKYPVKYSQMKAIYQGERIPHVGSFIAFLQSPAGYMCLILVFLGVLLIPMLEKKLEKEQRSRLLYIWAEEELEERKKYTVCMHGKYLKDCPCCNEKYRR